MKIEIDTKHDSPEEIKKVINMLQQIVEVNTYTPSKNIFEDPNSLGNNSLETPSDEPSTSTGSNAFVNLFGDAANEPKEDSIKDPEEETTSEEPSEEVQKLDDDIPEVIPY